MGSSLGSGWLALPICTIPRVKRQDEEKFKVTEIRNMQWDARGDKQKRRWKSQMNKKAVRSFFHTMMRPHHQGELENGKGRG